MSSHRANTADFPLVNPLLDGWEADAKLQSGIARRQQLLISVCASSRLGVPGHSGRNPTANELFGQRNRKSEKTEAAVIQKKRLESYIYASYSTLYPSVIYTSGFLENQSPEERKHASD